MDNDSGAEAAEAENMQSILEQIKRSAVGANRSNENS